MVELSEVSKYLDSTGWLGVGVLGALLFLVGIYRPALSGVPYGGYLAIGIAIAGGAIAVLGFSAYFERRTYERLHPRRPPLRGERVRQISIAPSLEVYDPTIAEERPRALAPGDPSEPSTEPAQP